MSSRADLARWQAYVIEEHRHYLEHTAGAGRMWADTAGARRHLARVRGTELEAAFSSPWHVVRPHLTTEFRQWVEEYEASDRLTLSQWIERDRAERAEVEWLESADHMLGKLDDLRRLTSERDGMIVEAARRGATKVAIAAAVGISRQQVHAVIAAAELAPIIPIRADLEPGPVASPEPADTAGQALAPNPGTAELAPAADLAASVETEWLQLASGEWVEVF